jgi:hypothetical protein
MQLDPNTANQRGITFGEGFFQKSLQKEIEIE